MPTNIRQAMERLTGTGTSLLAGAVAMLLIAMLGAVAALLSAGEVGYITMITAAGIAGVLLTRWAVLRVIAKQPEQDDKN